MGARARTLVVAALAAGTLSSVATGAADAVPAAGSPEAR